MPPQDARRRAGADVSPIARFHGRPDSKPDHYSHSDALSRPNSNSCCHLHSHAESCSIADPSFPTDADSRPNPNS